MDIDDRLVDYYTTRFGEDLRLQVRPHGRLEWLRMCELLAELLPEPAGILDVGGGPGVYARLLTERGHRVRLLDLVPSHVDQARNGEPPVEAALADARALPEPDGEWDATLLLGPLYHLPTRDDRVTALREAARVTRPGGLVLAAAISRFAGPLDFVSVGRLVPGLFDEARKFLTDGTNPAGPAYFHRVGELRAECAAAGLADVVIHGLEGPAWQAAEAAAGTPAEETVFAGALELARIYGTEPDLLAASSHLLAVGTVTARRSR